MRYRSELNARLSSTRAGCRARLRLNRHHAQLNYFPGNLLLSLALNGLPSQMTQMDLSTINFLANKQAPGFWGGDYNVIDDEDLLNYFQRP